MVNVITQLNPLSEYRGFDYAAMFDRASTYLSSGEEYGPNELLSDRQSEIRVQYDAHCVFEYMQRQSGLEWLMARSWTMSSTVGHEVVPLEMEKLSLEERCLLGDNLGRQLIDPVDETKDD